MGLLSESIIYDIKPEYTTAEKYTLEDLLATAQKELDAMDCMRKHFQSNKLLVDNYERIKDLLIKSLDTYKVRYIRKALDGTMRISYLSVDAHLENDKTVINFYTDINDLEKVLRAEGHTVKVMYKEIDTIADVAIENVDKNYQMAKITEVITKICEYLDKDNLFGVQLLVQKSDGLQRVITNHIINLGEYIDPNNLLHHIEKRSAERDSRG